MKTSSPSVAHALVRAASRLVSTRPLGPCKPAPSNKNRKSASASGGALLAVMWLSAALAAISLSVANTVRGETERTATSVDEARAYYLAAGAIEGSILRLQWGPPYYTPGQPILAYEFPTGQATVEIIPEAAKLNINRATPQLLFQLLLSLGADQERAGAVVQGILARRTPSFPGAQASFEEIEELLSLDGMTPDLYYGTYVRDTSVNPPQLVARGGLKDCVSVYGTAGPLDVNGAAPAAMAAMGVPPDAIDAVVAARPFHNAAQFAAFAQGASVAGKLRLGGNSIFTLRATARLRRPDGSLSDLRRIASALVKLQLGNDPPYVILRWYDRG